MTLSSSLPMAAVSPAETLRSLTTLAVLLIRRGLKMHRDARFLRIGQVDVIDFQPHHLFFFQAGMEDQEDQAMRAGIISSAGKQALHFIVKQQLGQRGQRAF